MYRSKNPTLSDSTFDKSNYKHNSWDEESNFMTMEGTVEKTAILLILTTTLAIATYITIPEISATLISPSPLTSATSVTKTVGVFPKI